jgi:hypothetical protein
MKVRIATAVAGLLAAPVVFASSNTVGFDRNQARLYCEGLADSYQVFPQDLKLYLARCMSNYRDSSPGENGSDISPHAASY